MSKLQGEDGAEYPTSDGYAPETGRIRQMTDALLGDSDVRLRPILILALASIIVGGTIDLVLDRPDPLSFHLVFEVLMLAGALLMATTLWHGWWRAERSVAELQNTLGQRSAERDEWQKKAELTLDRLAMAIAEQFSLWQLTPAEREVAMLLLKGHSHKYIARLTNRSERTVRQHAISAYHKAGVGGRVELAGFFLGGLVLPQGGDPNDS